jgi:uncharacterized protein YndB with AHSA1/START domain
MNAVQTRPSTQARPSNPYGVPVAPDTVRIERTLPGPIERVWRYLTDAEKRATWLAGGAMDQRIGGKVQLEFDNSKLTGHDGEPPKKYEKYACASAMQGSITACDPPNLLAYNWNEKDTGENSHVTFELSASNGKVRLVITHRRLASRDEMLSVSAGWHAHLDILQDRLEDREPLGFWPEHTRLEAEYEKVIPAK